MFTPSHIDPSKNPVFAYDREKCLIFFTGVMFQKCKQKRIQHIATENAPQVVNSMVDTWNNNRKDTSLVALNKSEILNIIRNLNALLHVQHFRQ